MVDKEKSYLLRNCPDKQGYARGPKMQESGTEAGGAFK